MRKGIYQKAMLAIRNNKHVKVDLLKHSVKVCGKMLIDNGKYDGDLGLDGTDAEDALGIIATAYKQYRHSIPNQGSDYRKCLFNALPEDDLSNLDKIVGLPRQVAQVNLELQILIMVLNGSIRWVDIARKESDRFYRFECDRTLRLMKEFFK